MGLTMKSNVINIDKAEIIAELKKIGTPTYFEINPSSVGSLCIEMEKFFDYTAKSNILIGYMFGKKVKGNDILSNNKIKFVYLPEQEKNKFDNRSFDCTGYFLQS